jgi:hypothetical protein
MANLTGYFNLLLVPKTFGSKKQNSEAALPPAGQKVLVQCEGYRGLAYRNSAGQWKTAVDRRNLPKDVEILPLKQAAP